MVRARVVTVPMARSAGPFWLCAPGKASKLTKINKIFVELTNGESGTLVHPVVFDRHTVGGPVLFQSMFCNQGVVGGEPLLE